MDMYWYTLVYTPISCPRNQEAGRSAAVTMPDLDTQTCNKGLGLTEVRWNIRRPVVLVSGGDVRVMFHG